MRQIILQNNKSLKLINVLKRKINFNEENINIEIEQFRSYIKTKGANQRGPLVQYSRVFRSGDDKIDIEMAFMFQCDKFIYGTTFPYSMESVIRVPNCMYCRYIGPEDKLKFAYDKIHLEAFENDIELEDCSYTIFVDRDEEAETIVADVFIPRKDGK